MNPTSSWASVLLLSWLAGLTKRCVSSRAVGFQRPPPCGCAGTSAVPDSRTQTVGPAGSSGSLDIALSAHLLSPSCPHSLSIARLLTIEHPVGRVPPECFGKTCLICCGGRAICPHCLCSFSSSLPLSPTSAPEHLDLF